jgi:hypothetical protein
VREIRTLRLTWRGLETWPWWHCEPIPPSKERDWKPSTYSRRACPRPYLNGGDEETGLVRPRLVATQLECDFSKTEHMHDLVIGLFINRSL